MVFSVSLLSLGGWLTVLGNLDPYQTNIIGRVLFFSFLFLWILGVSTLINYFIRIKLANLELIYLPFKAALRQSLFLALIIVGLLLFWVIEVLNWLSAGIFVLLIFSMEFYFQSRGINLSSNLEK